MVEQLSWGHEPSADNSRRPGATIGARRRRAAKAKRGRFAHVYSALDLGTNNCRLLVAKPTRDGFRVIDAFSRIVRLGEGIDDDRLLSVEAMDRTIDALHICARKMRAGGVTRARCVATEACRAARNGADFVARVKAETGLELDVIASAEEASLAAAGCAPLVKRGARHALIFDIGGGSTELIWLRMPHPRARGERRRRRVSQRIQAWTSIPVGVVTLAERFGGHDVDRRAYEAMIADVAEDLHVFERMYELRPRMADGRAQLIGTSGTVTTIAGVFLDLPRYDRRQVDGIWLERADAIAVSEKLVAMSYAERAAHPCIGNERADLVLAGCAIFEAICRIWPVKRFRVADRGLREGILQSLMQDADGEVPRPPQRRQP